jgi:type IV pilus assembly protein PilA
MISKLRDTEGFTLIELLIVVVIIGILAAIAIPQFSSTKEKAYDSAAKSDLRNIMTAEEAYFADNQTYTAVTIGAGNTADLDTDGTVDVSMSEGVSANVTLGSTAGFSATAQHQQSTNIFCISTTTGSSNPGEVRNQADGC